MTSNRQQADRIALYIHIPFCKARCAYCDFNTYAGLEDDIPDYVLALSQEIERAAQRFGGLRTSTIYFGGGTPSLLSPRQIETILRTVHEHMDTSILREVTLEANPGTVSTNRLLELRSAGIDRLSLGVQSARNCELRLLGRIHTWEDAVNAVAQARQAGFGNLSLDLIFGIPGQTLSQWRTDLNSILSLTPQHLSLYALSLEPGASLQRRVLSGELPLPDDDLTAEMYELSEAVLHEAGFFHYEISNWARCHGDHTGFPMPDLTEASRAVGNAQARTTVISNPPPLISERVSPYISLHNLTYWRNEPWIGMGAGAHSWFDGQRSANLAHPRDYTRAILEKREVVVERETIGPRLEQGETMMMGLRLTEGVSDDRFRHRFGCGLADVFERELNDLSSLGLLYWDGVIARLTDNGRLLGNHVFARFL